MQYAYVRKAKIGELPDGEYPFNVIRIHAEDAQMLIDTGYETTTHEDWLTNGGVPEGFEEKEQEEAAGDSTTV